MSETPQSGNVDPPAGRERRAWVRYHSTPETPDVAITEEDDIITWKARIRDISRGGVGLVVNAEFIKDAVVEIELPNTDNEVMLVQLARVVRCLPLDDGVTWIVACEFLEELTEEELRSVL
ncbi:MAG: hypothetical protein KatS3mg105_3663 [Gemmatales bacterium]|nr:MAG: hypothetical protein KatS3mg105_3663 [Gemmatales bacterium]